ncbi:hypothetical protein B0H13DRAFT_2476182 [Mycena leptocephala]|nr:hypothetical protein B0H13DRAFT_2476182 [Mycena leptocephala]
MRHIVCPILPPLEATQFWVRALRVCAQHRRLFSMSQPPVSTPTCIISQFDRPLNAHPSRLACRLLHPLCLASPTLSAYIPHPQLPRMRTHSVPVNCSGRPHASRPSHCPCTDAQHPAMCSATGMHLSGPMAAASAPVAHDRFVDVSPYGTNSPHCIPSPPMSPPPHPSIIGDVQSMHAAKNWLCCFSQRAGHGSVPRAPHIFI